MTMTETQKQAILHACHTLKEDTRKSLRVMSSAEIAKRTLAEATEAFRKSNAAYILAIDAYLNLPRLLHPNLRYRKAAKESLTIMLNKANLLWNDRYECNQYLKSIAQETNSKAIDPMKEKADKKPGKQLSRLLLEYTDYEVPKSKPQKKPKNDPVMRAETDEEMWLVLNSESSKRVRRKHTETDTPNETTLKKKISEGIKRKASDMEATLIKKKSSVNMSIFRKPTNEKAKAVLELWEDIDLSSSSVHSSPPQSPQPARRLRTPKNSDEKGSEQRSPRLWRRQARAERINESSRSESRTTLKRNYK